MIIKIAPRRLERVCEKDQDARERRKRNKWERKNIVKNMFFLITRKIETALEICCESLNKMTSPPPFWLFKWSELY